MTYKVKKTKFAKALGSWITVGALKKKLDAVWNHGSVICLVVDRAFENMWQS